MKRTDASCTRCDLLLTLCLTMSLAGCAGERRSQAVSSPAGTRDNHPAPATLDLRKPMALAAGAIVRRLDPARRGPDVSGRGPRRLCLFSEI